MTASAPFQDQLEHGARQFARENELQQITQRVTPEVFQQAEATYAAAAAARPDDFLLRYNYAALLTQVRKKDAAVRELSEVVRMMPMRVAYRIALGNALQDIGQSRAAREQYEAALKLDAGLDAVRKALGRGK